MKERYMIVTYILKHYQKWDELTEFKNRVSKKHLTTAKVILDFKEKKIVKNSLRPDLGYEELLEFYKRLLGDPLTPHLP